MMNPFDLNNPLTKNIVYVAHLYGQRPSKILEDLMNINLTPEEAIGIDIKSLDIIQEMMGGKEPQTFGEELERKWKQDDAAAAYDMERRRKEFERQSRVK